ncbi:MAG: polymer-forming cytoskeletal protein [Acidobacteriota bacterium]
MGLKFRNKFRAKTSDHLDDHELVGLLEPGLEFEGKMTVSSGMVRLNTHFKGEAHCSGALIIAEQGELEGEVHSKFVSVGGKIKGSVHATDKVEIKANGVVLGDIYTASLVIEPGGYFDGQCHMPNSEPANQPAEAEQKA